MFLPPTFLLYGRSGFRKTSSVYQALGPLAFWQLFERNALAPASQPFLQEEWKKLMPERSPIPDHVYCLNTYDPAKEADDVITAMMPQIRAGKYRAWVFDTGSTLAQRITQYLHAKGLKDEYGRVAKAVNESVLHMIHRLMAENLAVFMICHERAPSNIEGKITPGGPDMSGQGVNLLPAQFDVVLRVQAAQDEHGRYTVGTADELDVQYITKDRWGVCGPDKRLRMTELRAAVRLAADRSRGR